MRNLLLGLCLGLAGCARVPSEVPAAAPMPVSYPIERDVTNYADFTGRTAAVDSVEVRARVSGYLDHVNFKEGALVKKDDKLFEIDPRPYRAERERARGTVAQCDARVRRLERDYQRAKNLIVRGAVGQEEYDRYEADYRVSAGRIDPSADRPLARLRHEIRRTGPRGLRDGG
jgi:RND family efflux transporter MFP subunit